MKEILIICTFLWTCFYTPAVFSQQTQLDFFEHLVQINDYTSLELEAQQILLANNNDMARFYQAMAKEYLHGIKEASRYYEQISAEYTSFESINALVINKLIKHNHTTEAENYLERYGHKTQTASILQALQHSTLQLIRQNDTCPLSKPDISRYHTLLDSLSTTADWQKLTQHKTKSMFLAAVFSAIVPGSGKMYAGKASQGLTNLLMCTSLGAMSIENYYKNDIRNPKTIGFAALFFVFYTGNIYGSAFSAQTHNQEKQHETQMQLIHNLDIAYHVVFGL